MTTTTTITNVSANFLFDTILPRSVGVTLECIAESFLKTAGYEFDDYLCTNLSELSYDFTDGSLYITISGGDTEGELRSAYKVLENIDSFLVGFLSDIDMGGVTMCTREDTE